MPVGRGMFGEGPELLKKAQEKIRELERSARYGETRQDELRMAAERAEKRLDEVTARKPGVCIITTSTGGTLHVRGCRHLLVETKSKPAQEARYNNGYPSSTRLRSDAFIETKQITTDHHVVVHVVDAVDNVVCTVVNPISVVWETALEEAE